MKPWKHGWIQRTSIAIFVILSLTQFSPAGGGLTSHHQIAVDQATPQKHDLSPPATLMAQDPESRRDAVSADAHRLVGAATPTGYTSQGISGPAALYVPSSSGEIRHGWVLTFSDEFDGALLDRNKWATEYGIDNYCVVANPPPPGVISYCNRSNNDEKEWYVDAAPRLENGILKLVASKNDCSGDSLPDRNYAPYSCANFPYLSGMLSTHDRFSQLYGYFEARMKVPNGQGLWPAFWLIPQLPVNPFPDVEYFWPPEIDIMENRGDWPNIVLMTNHYSGVYPYPGSKLNNWSYGGSDMGMYTITNGPDFSADFHTFAVDWEPNDIIWYVDGVERFRSTLNLPPGTVNPPVYPGDMHIVLNLAAGGSFTGNLLPEDTNLPASLEVDYVRVYQKASSFVFLPYLVRSGQ